MRSKEINIHNKEEIKKLLGIETFTIFNNQLTIQVNPFMPDNMIIVGSKISRMPKEDLKEL